MEDLIIREGIVIPASELQLSFVRSRGPGGQHGDKANTKAVVRWSPKTSRCFTDAARSRFLTQFRHRLTQHDELILSSDETRSQRTNLDLCLERLRKMVQAALTKPRARKATRPTAGSRRRRRQSKEMQAQKKQRRQTPRMDDR